MLCRLSGWQIFLNNAKENTCHILLEKKRCLVMFYLFIYLFGTVAERARPLLAPFAHRKKKKHGVQGTLRPRRIRRPG